MAIPTPHHPNCVSSYNIGRLPSVSLLHQLLQLRIALVMLWNRMCNLLGFLHLCSHCWPGLKPVLIFPWTHWVDLLDLISWVRFAVGWPALVSVAFCAIGNCILQYRQDLSRGRYLLAASLLCFRVCLQSVRGCCWPAADLDSASVLGLMLPCDPSS